MTMMSGLGRGEVWGGDVYIAFAPCLSALGGFYVSHWEKYITGVMYLPWLYDVMQLVRTAPTVSLMCLLRGSRWRGGEGGGGIKQCVFNNNTQNAASALTMPPVMWAELLMSNVSLEGGGLE